jgi:hypothetical protein
MDGTLLRRATEQKSVFRRALRIVRHGALIDRAETSLRVWADFGVIMIEGLGRRVGVAGIVLLCIGASITDAQEVKRGATRVSPGGTTRVFVMAGFDAQCQSLPPAAIAVDVVPKKGSVSFRQGQSIVVQTSASGTCIGSRVTGTGIYYTAAADGSGGDSFSITARLASGETATRTFNLHISD